MKKKGVRKVSKSVKLYVKKALDAKVEDKVFQYVGGIEPVTNANSTSAAALYLNAIPKGTDRDDRIGNTIKVKSVTVNATFIGTQTAPLNLGVYGTQVSFRWALVQYKLPSDIGLCCTPANSGYDIDRANSVWISPTKGVVLNNLRNIAGIPNMVVLKSGKLTLDTEITANGAANADIRALYKRASRTIVKRFKKPLTIKFNDTTPGNTTSDTVKNSLWFCIMSDANSDELASGSIWTTAQIVYEDA